MQTKGKINIKHLSFQCTRAARLVSLLVQAKHPRLDYWGVGGGHLGVVTYRIRTDLRPLKAPSVMWLMELWPRRRVWRSPSTARLPSSRRVKLLYDRFLERKTVHRADRTEEQGRQRDGEEREKKYRGKKEKCSV